ncbi:LysE family translocator [Streptomyces sp. NPDC001177]
MPHWYGFVSTAVLISLMPGASQLLGLRNAVRYGTACALLGLGGRLAAFAVLVGLVVAGLGAMLAASATALTLIKWVGVAYLAWLGLASLRSMGQVPTPSQTDTAAPVQGAWLVIVNEFIVAISNPKALLLFAALLPQFAGSEDTDVQMAMLGAAYLIVELAVGCGYVALGTRLGATGMSARTRRAFDIGSGVCFIGLAGVLAVDGIGVS